MEECYSNQGGTAKNMPEYGFSLTRILSYKDRIVNFVLIRENMVSKNPYSRKLWGLVRNILNRF